MPSEVARYGPDIGTEADFRLCGDVQGRRVLELGCGDPENLVAFAKQGAVAIGVDPSGDRLAEARRLAAREGVRLELHEGDLADLAFVRADTIDLVFSAHALASVRDLNRVFRQVHRVLKPAAAFVFSLPHPFAFVVDLADRDRPTLAGRSYFDTSPIDRGTTVEHPHTVADVFIGLVRTGFRVDTLLEPERPSAETVPGTLILRARKEGI